MSIPSYITAAIFDMDGLMINSEPYWAMADKAFFEKYKKPYNSEINLHIMGRGQREIIEYYKKEFGFIGDTSALIIERKNLLYTFLFSNISLMEGVEDIIKFLYQHDIILAVATSGHTTEMAKKILEKVDLGKYFSVVISGDDVAKSKPAPDIYLKTAKILHVDPSECLVFEDASNGVRAGKAAAMTVYGINNGEEIYNKLKEAGADKVFKSMREIVL